MARRSPGPRRCCWPAAARPVTSRRCSPSPTPCADATPRWPSRRSAPRPGSRRGSSRRAATSCATCPRCRCPRRPDPATCCGCRATCAARSRAARGRHRRDRRRGRRRLRWLRLDAGLPRGPARRIPIVVHEQNARAGLANRLGARIDRRASATTFPGTVAAARLASSGCRCGARSPRSTARRAATRRDDRVRAGPAVARPSSSPADRSARSGSTTSFAAARGRAVSAAGVQVLHVTGAGKEFEPERPDVGAPYVVVPYADRMELAYAAADLVVCRSGANTVCELTAVGLPAVYVPAARSATASSGSTRPTSSPPVVASSSTTRRSPREWIPTTSSPLAARRRRGCSRWARPPRRSGERDADELLADLVHRACVAAGSRGCRWR